MIHLTYLEASVVGLIQGVTELFPVSSLGHNVLLPALIGGSWASDLNVAAPESPYLAYIVGLHVATAIGMIVYFWRDWLRIIKGFFTSLRDRDITTVDQKLAWMLIVATIPVGIVGLAFEHAFRVLFGVPIRAAIFLVVNGVILFAGERFRGKASLAADGRLAAEREQDAELLVAEGLPAAAAAQAAGAARAQGTTQAVLPSQAQPASQGAGASRAAGPAHAAAGRGAVRALETAQAERADERLAGYSFPQAIIIGSAQILALLAGISRDGVTMVAGMFRGLPREDAARFAFLLSTPVILAAGALKTSDLITLGHGIYGQILLGSVLSGIGAYLSVRFLVRYFKTRTLTPFAIYCVVFGLASIIYLQAR
jgi:undecaprenyl-diphosphatase